MSSISSVVSVLSAMPYNCAVFSCGHDTKRDKDRFTVFPFPAMIKHQGEQSRILSEERRRSWINNVARSDENLTDEKIGNTCVCSYHFISGKNIRQPKASSVKTFAFASCANIFNPVLPS